MDRLQYSQRTDYSILTSLGRLLLLLLLVERFEQLVDDSLLRLRPSH